MIIFKPLEIGEVYRFWDFLNALDTETSYMMYEPEERAQRTGIQELRDDIQRNVISGNDFLQIALEDHKIIGYIRAERGKCSRIFHTAYIVTGVLKEYGGKGIGTAFFENLEKWAKENGIRRLELTVECRNTIAKHLYEKNGFTIEGVREDSMRVDGAFIDEYYMAKIL